MLNPSNLLAKNLIDNNIDTAEVYGMNTKGPSSFENSDNDVVIPELNLKSWYLTQSTFVRERIDLLAPLTQLGIDIFMMVKEYVYESLSGELIQIDRKKNLYSSKASKEFKEK